MNEDKKTKVASSPTNVANRSPISHIPRSLTYSFQSSMTIVLGSMQSGKSTLINKITGKNEAAVGNLVQSMTKLTNTYRKDGITFLDTPGLEDVKDDSILIEIDKGLIDVKDFSLPIIVHKFKTPFTHGKTLALKEYKRVIPQLFDSGVMLMITDYSVNPDMLKMCANSGINPEKWVNEVMELTKKALDISSEILVLPIDLNPYWEEDKKNFDNVIRMINEKIRKGPVMKHSFIKFRKPSAWQLLDEMDIVGFKAEGKGYSQGIADENKEIEQIINERADQLAKKQTLLTEENKLVQNLTVWDSDHKILLDSKNFGEPWKFFTTEAEWNLETDHEITQRTRVSSNKAVFLVDVNTKLIDKGRITSGFLKGIYAEVAVYTDSRIIYKEDIKNARKKIKKIQDKVTTCLENIGDLSEEQKKHEDKLQKLTQKYEETTKKINHLSIQMLSLDELIERSSKIQRQDSR